MIKFKFPQFEIRTFSFLLFLFCSFQSYSNINYQEINELNEIKEIDGLSKQYRYFVQVVYEANNELENVEEWVSFLEDEKRKYKNTDNVVYINFMLIHVYRIKFDLDKAIDLGLSTYYSSFNIPDKNKFLCELLSMIEWCYHKKDNNLGLIQINKEKFKVCDKDAVDYHSAYYNMGLYDLALKSYKDYIDYSSPSYNDNYNLYRKAHHNNDIGVYYMYDNKLDSALYYYRKSIHLFESQNAKDSTYKKKDTDFMLTVVKGNIGTCLLKTGKYKEAIPFYLIEIKGCNIYYEGRNWRDSEKSYSRISLCYIKTNQFNKATFYINKLKNNKDLFYKLKSEYYNQLNNKDSTLFFKNKYIATSDSIFKHKLMQKDIESLNALDFNDKIKQQQQQINLLEEQDTSKSFQIKFISFTTFVVFILLIFLLYVYFDKIKKQKIVETQKSEIELALTNNKTLLKELNHRVKNNLQMVSSVISLQASKINDTKSKKHFYAAINRIKVLSEIHNSLYSQNELSEMDVLNYVAILKDYLVNSIINPEIKVNFIIDIQPNLYLSNDKKTTIGLIINELITNSFKYAFTNKTENVIQITIRKNNNQYLFSYKDNGQGFDYKNLDKTKSIGINLILRLVNQLGEEALINAKNGMHIQFNFKT